MAEVLVFHHGHGLTTGVREFAEQLRRAGHTVHTPDLFDGRIFDSLTEGIGYAESVGFGTIIARGAAAAEGLPAELVYLGFSLGALPAQKLAQTRPGAKGALLLEACVPVSEFGGAWPQDVPVQIHGMDADRSSPGRAMWRRPACSSRWRRMPSCSSTPATGTCSPTAACRRTTSTPQLRPPIGCSGSSTASSSPAPRSSGATSWLLR